MLRKDERRLLFTERLVSGLQTARRRLIFVSREYKLNVAKTLSQKDGVQKDYASHRQIIFVRFAKNRIQFQIE